MTKAHDSDVDGALVVGGGIGGLTAATALAREGVQVRVVEQASAFGALGAGIAIQANAMAVLRALEIELPEALIQPMGGIALLDAKGCALSAGDPTAMLPDPPSVAIHRADLHRVLVTAASDAGVVLETGRRVLGVSETAEGVRVSIDGAASQESEVWPLVVGADGAHSRLREALHGATSLRYSGQTCWRFAVSAPGLVPDETTERWMPGKRVGLFPLSQDRIYVYLVLDAPRGTAGPGSDRPERVRELFRGIDDTLDGVLERLDDDTQIHHDDLCDLPRPTFGQGRVVLIGDAAHPLTPNMGQGAGISIEDAAALALVVRAGTPAQQIAAALGEERRPRAESMLRTSWRIGRVAHWGNPLLCAVRDTLMRLIPASAVDQQARALWQPGIELAGRLA